MSARGGSHGTTNKKLKNICPQAAYPFVTAGKNIKFSGSPFSSPVDNRTFQA